MRDYLAAQGWTLIAAPDDFIEIWRARGSDGGELLLPTEQALDKEPVTQVALSRFAELNQTTVQELTRTIREYFENTISIRVVHSDVSDGSIPLEDGIDLNANARELLTAAANATLERRALYQGRLPAPVSSLIQGARLGQTTHGSYVIHVFCKDSTEVEQPQSFARAATQTLNTALTSLREAVETYESAGNSLAFEVALSQGVSANLCDAIAKLSGKDKSRTVEISIQQSQIDRLIPTAATTIEFLPSHQSTIHVAADYFRQTYTLHGETILGIVERLEQRIQQEDGSVRIAATLSNGQQRSVAVQLASDDYAMAIHAHENKQTVSISGDVVVTPRTATIIGPRDFAVLGNLELFGPPSGN
jgi:hypothetical protein